MSSTTPTIGATRTRPPATTIAAVALQMLIGTVTSFGGLSEKMSFGMCTLIPHPEAEGLEQPQPGPVQQATD